MTFYPIGSSDEEREESGLCPACGHVGEWASGPGGRPRAACQVCRSLERHRFLALIVRALGPVISQGRVLDVGPMQALTGTLAELADGLYVRTDLDPKTSSRTVDVIADLTRLPFTDESYRTVICYHVLEHIPDDRAAITELGRVLGDQGIAIIQVPWKSDAATDEDPAASIEQRLLRFGQDDHVRLYGTDFESRLSEAGLETTRITPQDFLDEWALRKLCLVPNEPVWIAARSIDGTVSRQCVSLMKERFISAVFESWMQASVRLELDAAEHARAKERAALEATQLAKEETAEANRRLESALEEAKAAAEDAARWEYNYQWLRSRMPVKIMAAVTRAGRTVARSVRSAVP